jgi:aryl-alcohol dehydrogenase-like predicted oxidoreductase
MDYRLLGNTGLKISSLSFGASSLGGVFHDIDEKEGIRAVHAAVDAGINYIDVSPYYGFTKAETVLGKALKEIDRKKYYISTKVGRFGKDGVKSWDYSAARAKQSIDESLKRLNIDYVDLLFVHDIEFSNLEQVINETLPALKEIKSTGKARFIGITGLPLEKIMYIADKVPQGTIESILSFCHYTLNDNSLVDFIPTLKKKEIGIINASPLSMGLLSKRGAPAWHPAPAPLMEKCKEAADYCYKAGYPIEKLAIQYSVNNPSITTTLVSSSSSANILQNIKWLNEEIDIELLKTVLEILKPVSRITWENS